MNKMIMNQKLKGKNFFFKKKEDRRDEPNIKQTMREDQN